MFLCKKIYGLYLGRAYTFLSCTAYGNMPQYYDGATFFTCQTDNCNYDYSLAQVSNGKTVSSCFVGGSFQ